MDSIQQQVEALIPRVRAKAERMCADAVGKRFSVRVDRRTVQYGVISQCIVGPVVQRGMGVRAFWKIVLENNGLHFGPFTVSSLPGGDL